MQVPLVYLRNRFIPQSEAALTLHDAGFVMGATVTDLCRTFRHRLFRLEEHLQRFRASCSAARISLGLSLEQLRGVATELTEHNAGLLGEEQDLALVMCATPGPIGFYLGEVGGPGKGTPTLLMHTFPLPFHRSARFFQEGVRLRIPQVRHVPAMCVDPRIKQRSRMHWWLAEQEVHDIDPQASALLLDMDGFVTETAAANLLVVRAGAVCSPPKDAILGGVSLATVEEYCRALQIPFQRCALTPEECQRADEAFLTNTSFCIAGVRSIDGHTLPWPGAVFERLLRHWSREVGVDIRGQILAAPAGERNSVKEV